MKTPDNSTPASLQDIIAASTEDGNNWHDREAPYYPEDMGTDEYYPEETQAITLEDMDAISGNWDKAIDAHPISLAEVEAQAKDNPQWLKSQIKSEILEIKEPKERSEYKYSIGELSSTTDAVESLMMEHDVQFYDRGGSLVRPILSEKPATEGRTITAATLTYVVAPYMTKQLSKIIKWHKLKPLKVKEGEEQQFEKVPIDPPPAVVNTILADAGDWKFHKIAGIVTAPTLRRDGSILWREGFDPQTKLLLIAPPVMPDIPERPTKADALKSIKRLSSLLEGFPFVSEIDRSVALSGLITPICRAAMTVAPLHAITAPTPASGKSYLVDLFSALISGTAAPVTSIGHREEETEKRLHSSQLEGSPIIVLDNVNGQLYGDALCQAVERPICKVRPLGESRMVEIENKATIFATGNNISLVDDMTRRTILCSLDAEMERPEMRQFKFNPMAEILDNRGAYIADVLTVVRAYKIAGSPGKLPQLASFGEWSDLVRSAIVWLGYVDPLKSMDLVRDADGRLESLKAFASIWYAEFPGTPKTAAQIVDHSLNHPEMQSALKALCNPRGMMDGHLLGNKLKSVDGKIIDGMKIMSEIEKHTKIKHWWLKKIEPKTAGAEND